MKIGIIIQARMGSIRLPHKMIRPFYNGRGILEILLTRLKENIDTSRFPVIIATSSSPIDEKIEKIGIDMGISVIKGSENDVLDRFITAATTYKLTHIIRICADNPLLDTNELQKLINITEITEANYLAFATQNLKPTILTSYGFWAESVSLETLKKISALTSEKIYREHVTNYVYTHPDKFIIHFESISPEIEKQKYVRLTIDTQNDFNIVREVYNELLEKEIDFSAESIVKHVVSNPVWIEGMKIEIEANKKE